MKSETFFGLGNLIRSKKEILWIGSKRESPPNEITAHLDKIKFVTPSTVKTQLLMKNYHSVVVSVGGLSPEELQNLTDPLRGAARRGRGTS